MKDRGTEWNNVTFPAFHRLMSREVEERVTYIGER